MKLAALATIIVVLTVACGPSESEVRAIVQEEMEQSVNPQLEDSVKQIVDAFRDYEERGDAARAEFGKLVDTNLVDSRKLYEEFVLLVKTHLEQLICDVDHKVNTNRSVTWWTLDHLAGGETTIEFAQEVWDGIAIEDEYGTSISGICAISEEGGWEIIPESEAQGD